MIEDLLKEVQKRGLWVHNLFQLQKGPWRANLRERDVYTTNDLGQKIDKGKIFHEFGEGPTPEAALSDALEKCP